MARNTRKRTAAAVDAEAATSAPESQPPAAPPQQASPASPAETVDDAQAETALATRPSKKARLSTKEQIAMLARELEETRASLKVAEESVRKYRKYKSMYVKEKTLQDARLIPRPDGERGKKGWTLRKALQLEGNTDMYLTILASVREAITAAGLDWKKTFHRQEASRLTDCYRMVKEQNPYLKRFEGDWPARELVISCMQNKRKTRNRRKKAGTSGDNDSASNIIDNNEDENDDEEDEDD
ncbi:hypothetical protein FRC04_004695 [Tulasnella sp. 424]|nr:hypothetical protein FRC04_004695 [Tulasnella sp. 424]KAG8965032.1 hypothetical protein FRC05_003507 [Tulasnella sp. 425]